MKGSLKAKLKECKAKLVEAVAQCEREAEKARSLEKANTSFAETSTVERRRLDKMQERVREMEERENEAVEARNKSEEGWKAAVKEAEKAKKALKEMRESKAELKREVATLKDFKKNAQVEKDAMSEELEVLKGWYCGALARL